MAFVLEASTSFSLTVGVTRYFSAFIINVWFLEFTNSVSNIYIYIYLCFSYFCLEVIFIENRSSAFSSWGPPGGGGEGRGGERKKEVCLRGVICKIVKNQL